jgi:hypothetical protein
MHGKGKLIYAKGDEYEGQFFNNNMHGTGTYKYTDGSKYTGKFD